MDLLSPIISRLSLSAGVFYIGQICGGFDFERDTLRGHLHLVRQGVVALSGPGMVPLRVDTPSLIFLPRPQAHHFAAMQNEGVEVVCGTVQLGASVHNPLSDALPDVLVIPLAAIEGMEALLDLMFAEARAEGLGRQAALDSLCGLLMVWMLRHCLQHGLAQGGTLAGLADPQLAKALQAICARPDQAWTLEAMALEAGMSRARFAARFKAVIGEAPAAYLARWRVALAERLLREGRALKLVAVEVGYGSSGALGRAFQRQHGCSPGAWLKR